MVPRPQAEPALTTVGGMIGEKMSTHDMNISKVVDGLRYDTEKAVEICSFSSSESVNDFRYERTTLFQTKHGRFFLAGYGGALSRWCRPEGNNGTTSGEGLEPVSVAEAQHFAEEHADADTVAQYFEVDDA